ncbi:ribonucleoside-diphosphate reductase beta chain [Lentzea xinjiangensis]|uniref:Ribonucleoside-diphosphate reductase beta chain n=1 Tax=Lentzea xinjiangensis TaxID=402600 RepID=A0A1H9EF84_9PSEU|nr:ribonucleoside-diphosphate reductase beta chain [Lentzea xinjiangensis]
MEQRPGFHPLRLCTKGNARFWNPADIGFSQDVVD